MYTGSGAFIGAGSKLGYAATGAGPFTYLSELVKFPLPKESVGDIESTNIDSPNLTDEFLPGFGNAGEIDFEGNFKGAEYVTLRGIKGVPKFWQIILVDTTTIVFPGYLKEIGGDVETKKQVMKSGKIKVSGSVSATGPSAGGGSGSGS